MIQDYVHDSSFVRYLEEIDPTGSFARADSIVVNGVGHDPVTGTGSYFNTTFTKGKKHVLRLINGSAGTHFIFSIDNHNFTVVENDLVPIEPYVTTSLRIGIGEYYRKRWTWNSGDDGLADLKGTTGQRYMIIVEANQEPGDYWMRTHPATGCNGFNASLPCGGIFDDTCEVFNVTTGIVRYDAASTAPPTTAPWDYDRTCADEPYGSLKPVVPWAIDYHPQNEITESRFAVAHQDVNSSPATGAYHHWMLTPDFLWLDFGNPTILNFDNGTYDRNSNFHIVEGEYSSPGAEDAYRRNMMSLATAACC